MHKVYKLFIMLLLSAVLHGQTDTLAPMPAPNEPRPFLQDSATDPSETRAGPIYVVSSDSIDEPVYYEADDRVVFDRTREFIHLYENAKILYKDMEIRAAYILIDLGNNIAHAEPLVDSLGNRRGVPHFKQGDQEFDAQKISYNFKTKKGSIKEVVSKEDDLFVLGRQTKFISKEAEGSGGDHIVYNRHAIITTCDHERPHFGIYSRRQKIIPNKLVVVGPSNLVIQDVPIPVWLPFGFFPISKSNKSGIILPNQYGYDPARGYYFRNFGYYVPISEKMDVKLIGDIFFRGSYRIETITNYKKRYKYSGLLNLQYRYDKVELSGSYKTQKSPSFFIDWKHNQEAGAHPYNRFGGTIRFETGLFSRNTFIDPTSQQQNTIRSAMTFSRSFPNSPFNLNASGLFDQNTATRIINITLPSLSVTMRSITPFKNKNRLTGKEKWYDRIAVSYTSDFANLVTIQDSLLFTKKTLDTLRYGARHALDVNATFKMFKYINLTPSLDYDEQWFFWRQEQKLLDTIVKNRMGQDSAYGLIQTKILRDFGAFRTMTAGLNLSTQLFGLVQSSRGWFRGLRHQLTPSVSLNFSPDYRKAPFNYFDTVSTDLRDSVRTIKEYIRFANGVYGTPSTPNENFAIAFSFGNRLELKYKNSKDSLAKKIPLIEGLNVSGNYHVFRDSFNLSNINVSGNTRLFKQFITMLYGFTFDAYGRKTDNGVDRRLKTYAIQSDRRLGYITQSYLNINTDFSFNQIRDWLTPEKNKGSVNSSEGTLASLFNDFRFNHIVSILHQRLPNKAKDTLIIGSHSLSINGNLPLSKNWYVRLSNFGYDFNNKTFTVPNFTFERNLHCWQMSFTWSPQLGSYFFTLGVKPGTLDFIRLPNSQGFRQF